MRLSLIKLSGEKNGVPNIVSLLQQDCSSPNFRKSSSLSFIWCSYSMRFISILICCDSFSMRFCSRESFLSLASLSIYRRAKRNLSMAADNDPEAAEQVDSAPGEWGEKGGIPKDPNVSFNVAPFSPSSPSCSPAGETTVSSTCPSTGEGAAPPPGPCFSSARTSSETSRPSSTNLASTASQPHHSAVL
ncbi:hypothetical protein NHX12_020971 [Muraenolepis orangiensis]|uniref:Uncharacterized protein n=1 Tax=Muraenolepis orangiensis TaxID=630683 RepID=A0A9Q0I1N2_9TELE|nr:hypothetical protein NHX12_023054 [Muraenolepis orangiensis]KAJ3583354.1 hypothetical protein NHX12_021931 [Muraenolepis orangiensis]KAJ3583362.1 hypothetical protein NHX12_020971 [Muraenolepis orangiensis]